MTKPKTPAQVVDALLDTVPKRKATRALDSKPDLVKAIARFLDLKKEGDERAHVTFAWFYRNKLRSAFDGPSYDAVRRYVTDVMSRNIETGKSLEQEA